MDSFQRRRQRRRRRRRRQKTIIFSIFAILVSGVSILLAGAFKAKSGPPGETTGASVQSTEVPTVTTAAIQIKTVAPKPTKEPTPYYNMRISKKDSYLLAKIAMAEAEGEPLRGKELVIMVVLNCIADDEFPDTVHDVIYQERQFSPIDDGRFDRVEPDKDCWKALENVKALEKDISDGALYFESCDYDNWHSQNLTFLYKYGNHKFYK